MFLVFLAVLTATCNNCRVSVTVIPTEQGDVRNCYFDRSRPTFFLSRSFPMNGSACAVGESLFDCNRRDEKCLPPRSHFRSRHHPKSRSLPQCIRSIRALPREARPAP